MATTLIAPSDGITRTEASGSWSAAQSPLRARVEVTSEPPAAGAPGGGAVPVGAMASVGSGVTVAGGASGALVRYPTTRKIAPRGEATASPMRAFLERPAEPARSSSRDLSMMSSEARPGDEMEPSSWILPWT